MCLVFVDVRPQCTLSFPLLYYCSQSCMMKSCFLKRCPSVIADVSDQQTEVHITLQTTCYINNSERRLYYTASHKFEMLKITLTFHKLFIKFFFPGMIFPFAVQKHFCSFLLSIIDVS